MTPRQKQYLKREDVLLALFQYSFRSYLLFLLLFAIGCLLLCYISLEPLGPYIYTSRKLPELFSKEATCAKTLLLPSSSSDQHRVLVVALLLGLYLSSPRAIPANLPESSLFSLIATSPSQSVWKRDRPKSDLRQQVTSVSKRVWSEGRVYLCNRAMHFSALYT